MTLIRHELKRSWKSLAVWTGAIGAFIIICLFMYPEMKSQTESISSLFSSMGAFSSAFLAARSLDFSFDLSSAASSLTAQVVTSSVTSPLMIAFSASLFVNLSAIVISFLASVATQYIFYRKLSLNFLYIL